METIYDYVKTQQASPGLSETKSELFRPGIILEQSRRKRPHLERVLIVAGDQNAGKSTLLRRMFVDPRLGTGGAIPTSPRIPLVTLSRERCLLFRLSSPHEKGESLNLFLNKLDRSMHRAWQHFWRCNLACAMQPNAVGPTPDLVTICREIYRQLWPERVRVVQIHPRQDNASGNLLSSRDVDRLRRLGVEVLTIDGRQPATPRQSPNGLLLADFFDFT